MHAMGATARSVLRSCADGVFNAESQRKRKERRGLFFFEREEREGLEEKRESSDLSQWDGRLAVGRASRPSSVTPAKSGNPHTIVIPTKVGIHTTRHSRGSGNPEQKICPVFMGMTERKRGWRESKWIPACAGMTERKWASTYNTVIPVQTGIHLSFSSSAASTPQRWIVSPTTRCVLIPSVVKKEHHWIPACAGMTIFARGDDNVCLREVDGSCAATTGRARG